ncbi:hypothetical protein BDV95DRAFT_570324, partial [Massariosphaeria phaeospora]
MAHPSEPPPHPSSTEKFPQAQSEEASSDPDPFTSLLTLEDTLYTTAYTTGTRDGALAGRIEGRIFGLEKGFDKFASLGALHGRACVWGARISVSRTPESSSTSGVGKEHAEADDDVNEHPKRSLNALPHNPRLTNNIHLLHALTDPLTFSTANTEDGVADFDDRVKRAGAKAKVIERIIGETADATTTASTGSPSRGKGRGVKVAGGEAASGGLGGDNMEDFTGSRLL